MKKGILIPLLLLSGLVGLFLAHKIAFAGTLSEEGASQTIAEFMSQELNETYWYARQIITPDIDFVEKSWQLKLKAKIPIDNWIQIALYKNFYYEVASFKLIQSDNLVIRNTTSSVQLWGTDELREYTILLENQTLPHQTAIDIVNYAPYPTVQFAGTNNSADWPYGEYTRKNNPDANIYDIYFKLEETITNTIAVEYPANESIIPDFLPFIVSIVSENPVSRVQMCYGISQSAVGDCQNSTSTWPLLTIDSALYSEAGAHFLMKSKALTTSTTYYGKAYLFDIFNIYLDESPEMSWYNTSSSVPGPEAVSSTLGIAGDWTGLLNLIKMKPPVGYFYSAINAWGGLNASGTPAVSLPSFGPIQTYIFTPIRTGIIFILWLIFGVWIFHRFRHIEL